MQGAVGGDESVTQQNAASTSSAPPKVVSNSGMEDI